MYSTRIRSFINYGLMSSKRELIQAFARKDREKLLWRSQPFLRILQKENHTLNKKQVIKFLLNLILNYLYLVL